MLTKPRKIGQNHIYFEHIFFASQTLPDFEGNTWDTWDTWDSAQRSQALTIVSQVSFRGKDLGHPGQRSGKTDTPGFSHESNVFKITGPGRRSLNALASSAPTDPKKHCFCYENRG